MESCLLGAWPIVREATGWWSYDASLAPPRRCARASPTLRRLGIEHALGESPRDGDCFYHAMARLLHDDAASLKARIRAAMTDDERAISDLLWSAEEPWADHVEIHACMRSVAPRACLVVVDEDHGSLSLHGTRRPRVPVLVLQLACAHYAPVLCANASALRQLFDSHEDCIGLDVAIARRCRASVFWATLRRAWALRYPRRYVALQNEASASGGRMSGVHSHSPSGVM